jgi:hypothetical protein
MPTPIQLANNFLNFTRGIANPVVAWLQAQLAVQDQDRAMRGGPCSNVARWVLRQAVELWTLAASSLPTSLLHFWAMVLHPSYPGISLSFSLFRCRFAYSHQIIGKLLKPQCACGMLDDASYPAIYFSIGVVRVAAFSRCLSGWPS